MIDDLLERVEQVGRSGAVGTGCLQARDDRRASLSVGRATMAVVRSLFNARIVFVALRDLLVFALPPNVLPCSICAASDVRP